MAHDQFSDFIDHTDIEERMLDSIEMLAYSRKYAGRTFLVGAFLDANLHNMLSDLRVMQYSGIRTIMVVSSDVSSFDAVLPELELLFGSSSNLDFSQEPIQAKLEDIGQNNQEDHLIVIKNCPDNEALLSYVCDLSILISAAKTVFLRNSESRFIELQGKPTYYINYNKLQETIEKNLSCSLSMKMLDKICGIFCEKSQDVVFINSESSALFREIFTYRGHGTLLSCSYLNEIRIAEQADILDIMMIMRPDILSGMILPISLSDLKKNINTFYVYCVDQHIVALCAIKDYGDGSELTKFCTLPRFRGKGRARDLALRLIEQAQQRKKKFIFALSLAPVMWSFFKSLGFEETNRENLPETWKKNYDFSRKSKAFIKFLD